MGKDRWLAFAIAALAFPFFACAPQVAVVASAQPAHQLATAHGVQLADEDHDRGHGGHHAQTRHFRSHHSGDEDHGDRDD